MSASLENELDALVRSTCDLCDRAGLLAESIGDHKRAAWWHGRAADFARYLAALEREREATREVQRE